MLDKALGPKSELATKQATRKEILSVVGMYTLGKRGIKFSGCAGGGDPQP